MANDLGKRVETAVEAVIVASLAEEQVVTFGETEEAGKNCIAVKADRQAEDPPGTGIFPVAVTVTAQGPQDHTVIDALEDIFSGSYDLASSLATEGSGSFVVPSGNAVDISSGSKTGSGLDAVYTYSFTLWCQTQEINDLA